MNSSTQVSQVVEAQASTAIQLDQLMYRWSNAHKPTLKINELKIQSGEQVFIAGPSGSGKSTLLGLMAGILAPTAGTIKINDQSLNALSSVERDEFRGDYIGFIFQQFNLIPYLTALENIVIPCHLSNIRAGNSIKKWGSVLNEAKALLNGLDLSPDLWSHKAHQLSVGQQQRVAAARALIGGPSLVIADEPTSALDVNRRRDFLNVLLSACAATGATLLFVSHDQEIMSSFSRSIYLNDINQCHEGEL